MSGICGIVALDGSEPTDAQIRAMSSLLERRGPDGTHHWRQGHVALGHTLLATTPEALHEKLPLTDQQSGCTITADVRLDNRDELIEAMGIEAEGRIIGDSELILQAYLRWGENCPKHLLGDFAFAIWDPRAGRLFCARDHMGMRQLIYCHVPGKVFAFATEPRAVLTHTDVPKRINEGRIADFLEGYLEGADFTSTFFLELYRLPPAHCLSLSKAGVRLCAYWRLAAQPPFPELSDEDYASGFLSVLTEAVRCRLRSPKPIGAMLSGGLDSNSVVAIANNLLRESGAPRLKTFSAVGPNDDACMETRVINIASRAQGLEAQKVSFNEISYDSSELIRLMSASGDPFDGHMTLPRVIYLAGQRSGVNVMLDGGGADLVLAADSPVARLLLKGKPNAAWQEAQGESRFWGELWTTWRAFRVGARQALIPNFLRRAKRSLQKSYYGTPQGNLLNRHFAKKFGLADRVTAYRSWSSPLRQETPIARAEKIRQPYLCAGRERYDRTASLFGIEPRDPFMDLRVINYCLKLPDEQLQSQGWPKIVMRRALSRLLPEKVAWRRGKTHLGWKFTQTLIANSFGTMQNFYSNASESANQRNTLWLEISRHWEPQKLDEHDIFEAGQLAMWLTNLEKLDDFEPGLLSTWRS